MDRIEQSGKGFLIAQVASGPQPRDGDGAVHGAGVEEVEAKALRENEDVKEFYLGIAEGKRKSFRDVKHYKRRKRWLA